MAISKQLKVYQLLNAWPEICLQDAWHFNQALGNGAPLTHGCGVFIQSDREQIARALNQAFNNLSAYLGFFPSPQWHTQRVFFGGGRPYSWQTLQADYGHLIEFGSRATTVIQAGAAVVYSDSDGDGVDDLGTVTVASTVNVNEVQLFFQTTDGAPAVADERYQIEPVNVSASGGTITITAPRWLFVKPSTIWDRPFKITDPNKTDRNYADTAQVAGFVTAVDVYRVYNDSTNAVQVLSDPAFSQNTQLNQSLSTVGVARIFNPMLGIFQVRIEDCSLCPPNWWESVYVSYRSGWPLSVYDRRMEHVFRNALCRLANTYMARELCPFSKTAEEIFQEDRENAETVEGAQAATNPFGILRGQVEAWRTVSNYAIVRSTTL